MRKEDTGHRDRCRQHSTPNNKHTCWADCFLAWAVILCVCVYTLNGCVRVAVTQGSRISQNHENAQFPSVPFYAGVPGTLLQDSANAGLVEVTAKKDGNILDLLAVFFPLPTEMCHSSW